MEQTKTFADYTRSPRRSHGCPLCGETTGGMVAIHLRERVPRVSGPGRMITSRQVSLCEPHAVEVFEAALKTLPS